ncbi:hypothetical protein L0Y40_01920 [Candidatus Wolfebacteria bacterium]|nr:hypothetical protein [Candidatus Wolfebacteria bacterium]
MASKQEAQQGKSIIAGYLKEVFDAGKRGDAREESFYPALKSFVETIGALWGVRLPNGCRCSGVLVVVL